MMMNDDESSLTMMKMCVALPTKHRHGVAWPTIYNDIPCYWLCPGLCTAQRVVELGDTKLIMEKKTRQQQPLFSPYNSPPWSTPPALIHGCILPVNETPRDSSQPSIKPGFCDEFWNSNFAPPPPTPLFEPLVKTDRQRTSHFMHHAIT